MINLTRAIRVLRQHQPYLRSHFSVVEMYIFGSVARRENRPSSDIDILVSFEDIPSIFTLERFRKTLRQILQSQVDVVVDTADLSPGFKKRVAREWVKV